MFLGAFSIASWLGALVGLVVVVFGMMTALLPQEVLPSFWANGIYPWVPQPFIATGLRDILYMGAGALPRGTGGLVIYGVIGLALLVGSAFVRPRSRSGWC